MVDVACPFDLKTSSISIGELFLQKTKSFVDYLLFVGYGKVRTVEFFKYDVIIKAAYVLD